MHNQTHIPHIRTYPTIQSGIPKSSIYYNAAVKEQGYDFIIRILRHIDIPHSHIYRRFQPSRSLSNLLLCLVSHFLSDFFRDFGTTPKTSQPPSVLKKAHAECKPSFNSPELFFSSRVFDSPADTNSLISSIVISLISHFEKSQKLKICNPL